jgi:hypothetical protein
MFIFVFNLSDLFKGTTDLLSSTVEVSIDLFTILEESFSYIEVFIDLGISVLFVIILLSN